jgi:putative ABC transport system substrate-binding protein
MRRREFITFLSGTAVGWPLTLRAQQPAKVSVIWFLNNTSPETYASFVKSFHQGLRQSGYVEAKNVAVEYRWGRNEPSRLPALARELVSFPVAVIVASGGDQAVEAVKAATQTIPIVATIGSDPVASGLVSSVSRPDGNVTAVSVFAVELVGKRWNSCVSSSQTP